MNSDLFDLEGKIIVVTGGMGQLGGQFVKSLVVQGAKKSDGTHLLQE